MERDDLIINDQYSVDAHHDDETGKKIRKKIIFVTLLLTVITIVEVIAGMVTNRFVGPDSWELIKWSYVILTLVKAGYIVMVFMHLGDERKSLKWVILAPYLLFIIYLIYIAVTESNYLNYVLNNFL